MYIKAKVAAGAKKESIIKVSADTVKVAVREPRERNMANRRVMELVAEHFGVSAGRVRLISGHHSSSKILSVDIGD